MLSDKIIIYKAKIQKWQGSMTLPHQWGGIRMVTLSHSPPGGREKFGSPDSGRRILDFQIRNAYDEGTGLPPIHIGGLP
jgi:hypothetical protein